MNIENLIRPNIARLVPYSSARSEYDGTEGTFLDANENPFGNLNRYPDPQQKLLKQKLGFIKKIPAENIFIGNGSDEVIDLALRIFCNPGVDKVLTFTPTYGMYSVAADINDVELISLPLDRNFQIDFEQLKPFLLDETIKIIFICSPNNPTGNSIQSIHYILENFRGLIFLDEAYIDFSVYPSALSSLMSYPNLLISQTLSKAYGLAAARVGIAYASADIIRLYNKVKPPYNVSSLNQDAALQALSGTKVFELRVQKILKQRDKVRQELEKIPTVFKIYPTEANFFLVEFTDADKVYNYLLQRQVITRNRNGVVKNCIRITIGSKKENKKLITALKKMT